MLSYIIQKFAGPSSILDQNGDEMMNYFQIKTWEYILSY